MNMDLPFIFENLHMPVRPLCGFRRTVSVHYFFFLERITFWMAEDVEAGRC